MSSQVVVSTGPSRKRTRAPASKSAKKIRGPSYRRFNKAAIGQGFPDKLMTTMRYFEWAPLTAAGTTEARYFVKANGIYDANTTGSGHQPLGYDQFTPIYNHWVVTGARIKATFTYRDEVSDVVHPIVVGIYDDDDGTNTLTYSALAEGTDRTKVGVLTTNTDKVVLYSSWKNAKTFGPATVSDPSQRGSATADPSETHQWCLWVYNVGNTSHTLNVVYDIEYQVTWFERKDLASS